MDEALRAMALLDLTNLDETCSSQDIQGLCLRARGKPPGVPVAAVCVWPRFVAEAKAHLAGSGIRVATVVNFPSGTDSSEIVLAETAEALGHGADEIDCVIPYAAFLSGNSDATETLLAVVRAAVPPPARLKVILETGVLKDAELIRRASNLAISSGADFIKTSTGKTPVSATLDATAEMLQAIRNCGRHVGLKPSGGIRTLEQATAYLAQADAVMGPAWARAETFRFGASGLHGALMEALGADKASGAGSY